MSNLRHQKELLLLQKSELDWKPERLTNYRDCILRFLKNAEKFPFLFYFVDSFGNV